MMTFEELCEAIRVYAADDGPEGGWEDAAHEWRNRLDGTLADVRAVLSTYYDRPKPVRLAPEGGAQ